HLQRLQLHAQRRLLDQLLPGAGAVRHRAERQFRGRPPARHPQSKAEEMNSQAPVSAAAAISLDELLEQIETWVGIETPTDRPEAVNRLVDHVEAYHRGLGMAVERRQGHGGRGDKLIV